MHPECRERRQDDVGHDRPPGRAAHIFDEQPDKKAVHRKAEQVHRDEARAHLRVVLALAVPGKADPAMREIADDNADDERDANRGIGVDAERLDADVIDRLPTRRDQRADNAVADELREGGVVKRFEQHTKSVRAELVEASSLFVPG